MEPQQEATHEEDEDVEEDAVEEEDGPGDLVTHDESTLDKNKQEELQQSSSELEDGYPAKRHFWISSVIFQAQQILIRSRRARDIETGFVFCGKCSTLNALRIKSSSFSESLGSRYSFYLLLDGKPVLRTDH